MDNVRISKQIIFGDSLEEMTYSHTIKGGVSKE